MSRPCLRILPLYSQESFPFLKAAFFFKNVIFCSRRKILVLFFYFLPYNLDSGERTWCLCALCHSQSSFEGDCLFVLCCIWSIVESARVHKVLKFDCPCHHLGSWWLVSADLTLESSFGTSLAHRPRLILRKYFWPNWLFALFRKVDNYLFFLVNLFIFSLALCVYPILEYMAKFWRNAHVLPVLFHLRRNWLVRPG